MGDDGQGRPGSVAAARRSLLRSSIVWKLTVFVGVLVALNGAVLIAVAYFTTSAILRDQIHKRLSTVATARQAQLTDALRHLQDKALQFANRARVERLVAERAAGKLTALHFRTEAEAVLSNARVSTSGILALWVE